MDRTTLTALVAWGTVSPIAMFWEASRTDWNAPFPHPVLGGLVMVFMGMPALVAGCMAIAAMIWGFADTVAGEIVKQKQRSRR
jgi:hypothetical protein